VLLRFEEIEEALPDLGCGHREMEWIGVGRRARAVGEGSSQVGARSMTGGVTGGQMSGGVGKDIKPRLRRGASGVSM
jgi:hypothetical protein